VNEIYPKWIDEHAAALHKAFSNMVPTNWGPVDYKEFIGCLNGTFIAKVAEAIKKIQDQGISIEQVADSFPSKSTLRVAIYYLMVEYQHSEPKPAEEFKAVVEYLAKVLDHMFIVDVWAKEKNIAHTDEEVADLLAATQWQDGTPETARELGKLHNSLSAHAYALYRDYFVMLMIEIYGPYDTSYKFGNNTILLIKDYVQIKPVELWPATKSLEHEQITIMPIYRDVKFECEWIGMHSLYEGDLMSGLVAYAVLVDGEPVTSLDKIKELSDYYAEYATKFAQVYESMTKQELIVKSLEWECYQFFNMFKLANMDWRPTNEMLNAFAGKEIGDRTIYDTFPDYEEYVSSPDYEVYWLKKMYA